MTNTCIPDESGAVEAAAMAMAADQDLDWEMMKDVNTSPFTGYSPQSSRNWWRNKAAISLTAIKPFIEQADLPATDGREAVLLKVLEQVADDIQVACETWNHDFSCGPNSVPGSPLDPLSDLKEFSPETVEAVFSAIGKPLSARIDAILAKGEEKTDGN